MARGTSYMLLNEPIDRARRGDRQGRAVRGAGALHLERLGGDVLRAARRARVPETREDHEVRGRLPRHPRLRADERRAALAEGVSGADDGLGRHAARARGRGADRAVQRPGDGRGADRRAPRRAGRGASSSPTSGRSCRRPASWPGLRAVTRRYGVPLDLRRDRDRLPLRLRRRPGILRRRARPGGLRQGDGRRVPARVHRRTDRDHAPLRRRARGHTRLRLAGRDLQRQRRSRPRPAWRRWPSSGSPACTSGSSRPARALREGLAAAARKHGLPAQVSGEPPVFDIFFTDREVVDYRATLDGRPRPDQALQPGAGPPQAS